MLCHNFQLSDWKRAHMCTIMECHLSDWKRAHMCTENHVCFGRIHGSQVERGSKCRATHT
jgi:hypothetical protein